MVLEPRLTGLWRRSLIAHSDGRRDSTTWVRWLQGTSAYVDLRQPADRPSFDGVTGAEDLLPHHLDWMARQLAFAGHLSCVDGVFEWHKTVDMHPITPDLGTLHFEQDVLVERAVDLSYTEHWHRDSPDREPVVELDDPGLSTVVVQVGGHLGFARRDSTGCEVSMAEPSGDHWRITRSSLPWREGESLTHPLRTRVRDPRP